jgi:hypothetical protein
MKYLNKLLFIFSVVIVFLGSTENIQGQHVYEIRIGGVWQDLVSGAGGAVSKQLLFSKNLNTLNFLISYSKYR